MQNRKRDIPALFWLLAYAVMGGILISLVPMIPDGLAYLRGLSEQPPALTNPFDTIRPEQPAISIQSGPAIQIVTATPGPVVIPAAVPSVPEVAPPVVPAAAATPLPGLVEQKYNEALDTAVNVMVEKRLELEATQDAIRAQLTGGGG